MNLGTFKRTNEAKRIIIDIETKDPLLKTKGISFIYGLGHIAGIAIKIDNEPSEYYPINHLNETCYDRDQVKSYLHDIPKSIYVVGHYSYYDLCWLFKEFQWLHDGGKYRDTLLTSQLYNNALQSHSLESMCYTFNIGQKIDIGNPPDIWKLPISTVANYANHDADLTGLLDDKLWKERDSEACERECQLVPILVQMKHNGIKINKEQLDNVQRTLHERYFNTMALIPEIKNIWSNASVATFFRRFGIPYGTTDKGTPSFPQWYLESIDHPKIESLAHARKLHKLINTFCMGIRSSIAEDGNIHPDFFNGRSEYGGTVTGRFSSANPNCQQIPNRTEEGQLIRSVFVPKNKAFVKFDYSQQEPRLMIHYASKLNLKGIDYWRNLYKDPNADFYKPIQEMLNIERFPAKTLTLGICYNMGYSKMARMSKISEEEAKRDLYRFRRAVPWLIELKQYCENKATSANKIRTIGNRYLNFTLANVSDAFNHLIQGSAADQTKQAMLNIYNRFKLVPLLQVHDELDYDFDTENLEQLTGSIEQIMINAFKLDIPTKVDVKLGKNWMECK